MCRDVAIVGAGPAGSALAALLARAGREVLLLEKDAFPRHKLCGEFLSTESQALLEKIGALDAVRAAGAVPIEQARFTAPSGAQLTLDLPGTGLGISRFALDLILFEHARACGVQALDRTEVTAVTRAEDRFEVSSRQGAFTATRVVGAWGRRARLDKALARDFTEQRHGFLGLKRHHRGSKTVVEALQNRVEIHTVDGGYCGMSLIETGEVNVCMLLDKSFMAPLGGSDWATVCAALGRQNGALADRLTELSPSEEAVHAVAEIPFTTKELVKDGILYLGDAAAMIAPLVGDGQAMALDSAVLLAELLLAQKEAAWPRRWRGRFSRRLALARRLQDLLLKPKRADRVIRVVGGIPGLPRLLARMTRG